MSTKTKHSLLLICGAIAFIAAWIVFGEWDVIENMSTNGQLWVSLGFLVLLLFVSYKLLGGRKR